MAEEELEQVWDAVDAALDLASRTGEVLFDAREALKTLRAPVDPPERVSEQDKALEDAMTDLETAAFRHGASREWEHAKATKVQEARARLRALFQSQVERVSEQEDEERFTLEEVGDELSAEADRINSIGGSGKALRTAADLLWYWHDEGREVERATSLSGRRVSPAAPSKTRRGRDED